MEIDALEDYQKKGAGSYWSKLTNQLIDIAYILEQPARQLVREMEEKDEEKYRLEHQENREFYEALVKSEDDKFTKWSEQWNDRLKQFHILKQNFNLETFKDRINSFEFMNPIQRVKLFKEMRDTQVDVHKQRYNLIK